MIKVGIFALGLLAGGAAWAEEGTVGKLIPGTAATEDKAVVETPGEAATIGPERLGQSIYRRPQFDDRALDAPMSIPTRSHNCGRTSSPSA